MADIEKLIQDLQSDDLELRYNACKQLGVEKNLSKEAIEALLIASTDPDPLIAVTANRAMGSQNPMVYENIQADYYGGQEEGKHEKKQSPFTCFERIILCQRFA